LPAGTTQETSERVKQLLAGPKGLQDDEDRSDWLDEMEEGRDGGEFGVQHSLPCRSSHDMLRHAISSLLHWEGVVNVVAAAAPIYRCCCYDMTTHSADNTILFFTTIDRL
jgi:hypothetical protein